MPPYDLRLKPNFKLFIHGPSRSGKTHFIGDLLKNKNVFTQEPPKLVVYVYKVMQPKYEEMPINILIPDQPNLDEKIFSEVNGESALIVFDDLMSSDNLDIIARFFTVDGRHNNLSMIFTAQNMFVNNDHFRQISQNSDYLVLFKNPRNASTIRTLCQQMTPGKKDLLTYYNKATTDPYSYFFVNVTQECNEEVKYLSHLFNKPHTINVYNKNAKKTLVDLNKGSQTNFQEMYDSSLRLRQQQQQQQQQQQIRKRPQAYYPQYMQPSIELRKALYSQKEPEFINYSNRPRVVNVGPEVYTQREPEFINYSNRARVVNVRPEVSHVHIPTYDGVGHTLGLSHPSHRAEYTLHRSHRPETQPETGGVATETRDVGIGTQSETRDVATETQFRPETRDVGTDMIQSNYGIISFNDWQRQAIQQQQHQIQPRQQHNVARNTPPIQQESFQQHPQITHQNNPAIQQERFQQPQISYHNPTRDVVPTQQRDVVPTQQGFQQNNPSRDVAAIQQHGTIDVPIQQPQIAHQHNQPITHEARDVAIQQYPTESMDIQPSPMLARAIQQPQIVHQNNQQYPMDVSQPATNIGEGQQPAIENQQQQIEQPDGMLAIDNQNDQELDQNESEDEDEDEDEDEAIEEEEEPIRTDVQPQMDFYTRQDELVRKTRRRLRNRTHPYERSSTNPVVKVVGDEQTRETTYPVAPMMIDIRGKKDKEKRTLDPIREDDDEYGPPAPKYMSLQYECKICGKKLKDDVTLRLHEKDCIKTSFGCQWCRKNFKSRSALSEHVRFMHSKLPMRGRRNLKKFT